MRSAAIVCQLLPDTNTTWIIAVGTGLLVLIVLFLVFRGRRSRPTAVSRPALFLDVRELGEHGPGPEVLRLELYNMPVRLAAVVIAPVGRDRAVPSTEELRFLLDAIVPGLGRVAESHRPTARPWPTQLSVQGFHQSFFNNAPLPGDHGKGSPWCSLAGKFSTRGHAFVAGLVFCGDEANSVGQVVVQHDAQWIDMLRLAKD